MSENTASTIRMNWVPPPGSPEIALRTSYPATRILFIAWIAWVGALFLNATSGTPGYLCLLGTAMSAFAAAMGDLREIYPASFVLPNLCMLLSPIAAFIAIRKRRAMPVLTAGSAIGALLAISFPVVNAVHPYRIPECGGMTTYFSPEAGTWVWIAAQVLLAVGLFLTGRNATRAK